LVDNYQLLGGTCCLHIQGEKVLLASNFRTWRWRHRFLQDTSTNVPNYITFYKTISEITTKQIIQEKLNVQFTY
jgi:hypothetical protein